MSLEDLIIKLYDINSIKLESVNIRTGELTPIYVDMRLIWSYPDLVKGVCNHIWASIKEHQPEYNMLCGMPYQGIPLASYISTSQNIPMILKRTSTKHYGTKRLFEGVYSAGDKVVILDDVLMTGATMVDAIPEFKEAGLEVTSMFCFLDRDQGGSERVNQVQNIPVYSVVTLANTLDILVKAGRLTQANVDPILEYLKTNRWDTPEYGCMTQAVECAGNGQCK